MPAHSTAARLWISIEDRLIPALRLTTHERAIYYHLLRRTRLVGRRMLRISRRQMARVSGLSTYTARHYFRLLARKQCIRFVDRGSTGCLVSVFVPGEIFERLRSAPSSDPLSSLMFHPLLDAAGQPRAWPRSDHFRNEAFRESILTRDRHRCFYCRRLLHPREWTLDHVVPIALGGSDLPSNLVACCHACNSTKADMPAVAFLKSLTRSKVLSPAQLRARNRRLHLLQTLTPGP